MSLFARCRAIRATVLAACIAIVTAPLSGVVAQPATASGRPLLIFAAASLNQALDEVAKQWQRATGKPAIISYAASSALARQIEKGAPADLFISADLDWMAYLATRDLIEPGTRINLLGNRLVLVAPRDVSLRVVGMDIPAALGDGKLAMATLDAVPAGKYGKAALENLGMWPAVKDHVVQADNVRAALVLVARGEARLGIVYQTDAEAEPGVRMVAPFPDDSYPPVIYPAAILRGSRHGEAASFAEFLRSSQADVTFEGYGFMVLR